MADKTGFTGDSSGLHPLVDLCRLSNQ